MLKYSFNIEVNANNKKMVMMDSFANPERNSVGVKIPKESNKIDAPPNKRLGFHLSIIKKIINSKKVESSKYFSKSIMLGFYQKWWINKTNFIIS